jgi:uncharacterized caspase-like protein
LEPGLNVLSITASDKDSTSEPKTTEVMCTNCGRANKPDKPDLIFLGIGISKYQNSVAGSDFANLSFADRDVIEMAEAFEKQSSLQPPEKRVFNKVTTKVITNAEANKETILGALEWLNDEANKNSNNVHVLYLSGHGGMDKHEQYYFFSTQHATDKHFDVSDIPWPVVMQGLTDTQGKAVIFIDTCHAGGSRKDTDLITLYKSRSEDFMGVFTFVASDTNGVSIEKPELQHGVFTRAVLDGLLKGEADKVPIDGKISSDELGLFIKLRVAQLADDQHAGYFSNSGFGTLTLFSNPLPR